MRDVDVKQNRGGYSKQMGKKDVESHFGREKKRGALEKKDKPRIKKALQRAVQAQRHRWLGHVESISKERMPKVVVLNRKPIGRKRKGRPMKRWNQKVEEGL